MGPYLSYLVPLFQIKRISLQTCGNELNLHENEPLAGAYFHMNSFAGRLILQDNSEICPSVLDSLFNWFLCMVRFTESTDSPTVLKNSHYKQLSYDLALYGFLLLISYYFRRGKGGWVGGWGDGVESCLYGMASSNHVRLWEVFLKKLKNRKRREKRVFKITTLQFGNM